jgi:hypothetical protein
VNLPQLSHRVVARQQGRFLLAHRAQTLELDAPAFKDLLRRVEEDTLFRRLLDVGLPGGSLVKRRSLSRMRGRSVAGHADMENASGGTAGFDVGRTLADHAEGVDVLRRLGPERAESLLKMEDLAQRKSCIKAWGVDEESSGLLQALLDHLSVFGAMATLDDMAQLPVASCALVAQFDPGLDGGFVIVPLVSYFRTERYLIEYERITEARRTGLFSEEESKRLPSLLGEVEAINFRGDTLHKILCAIADANTQFLRSGRDADIAPLTQLNLAQTTGAHPSAVCRTVSGRSVLTPWGEELALSKFFPGRRKRNAQAVADILSEEPRLSDREVALRLRERFGFRISRRSAALYRCGLSIPNSYRRGRGEPLGPAEGR